MSRFSVQLAFLFYLFFFRDFPEAQQESRAILHSRGRKRDTKNYPIEINLLLYSGLFFNFTRDTYDERLHAHKRVLFIYFFSFSFILKLVFSQTFQSDEYVHNTCNNVRRIYREISLCMYNTYFNASSWLKVVYNIYHRILLKTCINKKNSVSAVSFCFYNILFIDALYITSSPSDLLNRFRIHLIILKLNFARKLSVCFKQISDILSYFGIFFFATFPLMMYGIMLQQYK